MATANATLVIKYNGAKLTEKRSCFKNQLLQLYKRPLVFELGFDSASSIEQTGIDFTKEMLQYALTEDSSNSFVTIVFTERGRFFLLAL
jgi:hypothetical protein